MIHTRRLRPRLSYANVMSTMAVFVALGGSSYAAVTINGSSIRNRSIPGAKLRHDTLTGRQIKESNWPVCHTPATLTSSAASPPST